jgi:hypothetical protein
MTIDGFTIPDGLGGLAVFRNLCETCIRIDIRQMCIEGRTWNNIVHSHHLLPHLERSSETCGLCALIWPGLQLVCQRYKSRTPVRSQSSDLSVYFRAVPAFRDGQQASRLEFSCMADPSSCGIMALHIFGLRGKY